MELIENNICVTCEEGPVKILKADITQGKILHLTMPKLEILQTKYTDEEQEKIFARDNIQKDIELMRD